MKLLYHGAQNRIQENGKQERENSRLVNLVDCGIVRGVAEKATSGSCVATLHLRADAIYRTICDE
jgi:hypothetical protein